MKISIVTATFNSGATIADTLRSVLGQTYRDYELIVVDGLSHDNTMDIVRQMEPQFEGRLRYISEPDHGLYDAMNKGIRMATGDVVGILNSDDFYSSNTVLATIAKTLEEHKEVEAVYGDVHYVSPDNLQKCVRYYSSRWFGRRWMRLGFMPAHPSFYCRKSVYQQYGGFDTSYKVAADFEHVLRTIYLNHIRTRYIHLDFVTMRTGGASNAGLKSHVNIMNDHLRALQTHGVWSCSPLLALRYVYKLGELAMSRITTH